MREVFQLAVCQVLFQDGGNVGHPISDYVNDSKTLENAGVKVVTTISHWLLPSGELFALWAPSEHSLLIVGASE